MITLLLIALANAGELEASLHGDVKTFGTAIFPYEHILMPPEASGTSVWNLRLKGEARYQDWVRVEVHHVLNSNLGDALALGGFGSTGVNVVAPEVVQLGWEHDIEGGVSLTGRTDRANVLLRAPNVDITLGRQAVSFGNGLFFTPLDLVSPFSAATIDSDYKPGVDAVRVDGFIGMTGKITGVAAYAGDWSADGTVLALNGQGTVGVTDLGGFAGLIRDDVVLGTTVVSAIGPVGIHSDIALTLPEDDDAYLRAVLGGVGRPTGTTIVSGELYLQTMGAADPADYLGKTLEKPWAEQGVWTWGRMYTALTVTQELTPLLSANLASIVNVEDGSALLLPAVSWSVSENTDVGLGAFMGVGKRPGEGDPLTLIDPTTFQPLPDAQLFNRIPLASEFGTYPMTVFASFKAYW